MPGKTPANRAGKDSANSIGELSSGKTGKKYKIWPKWNDDEVVCDKKESAKPAAGEGRRKGTAASSGNVDIDGSAEDDILPQSLKNGTIDWIKPGLFITAPRTPVVVAEPIPEEIDLISENKHLLKSELMCSIISQLHSLWHNRGSPSLATRGPEGGEREWRPWQHIQHNKEHHVPLLNPHGSYGVKIFWMGAWRKITVTHYLPLRKKPQEDTDGGNVQSEGVREGEESLEETREVLLPRTANTCELWPAIITKAILKVAALDSKTGSEWKEFGDCSVLHMMTGWYPQTLPTRIESDVLWETLCQSLPLWKRSSDSHTDGASEDREESEPTAQEGEGEGEREREAGRRMVVAQFNSAANGRPLTRAKETIMAESVALLKKSRVVSEVFDCIEDHAQCIFVRQVRDIPLKAPPKEPPPIPAPEEHAWLGYSLRRYEPWKGPPPKPHPPRWVELLTPFATNDRGGAVSSTHSLEEVREEEEEGEREEYTPEGAGEEVESSSNVQSDEGSAEGVGIWMKFEDFRKAFSSVEVFTPPAEFRLTQSYKDMTATVEMVTQEETKGKGRASHSPANKLKDGDSAMADDTNILFMEKSGGAESDEVHLHCVFSCLSNWREGSKDLKTERKKSMALHKRKESILSNPLRQRFSFQRSVVQPSGGLMSSGYAFADGAPPFTIPEADEEDSMAGSSVQLPQTPCEDGEDGEDVEDVEMEKVVAGVLVLEEFDWKSVRSEMPLLRLVTSGVKGAIVKLNPSKRMFRIHVKSPVGYHLSLSSDSQFVLYNESSVYDRMHKEGMGFSKVYCGPIPPLQPNSWAVLFREVLHVRRDDQLLAFRLDCPVSGHQLRVVDNDDGREMPRVAHITEPQEYSINKKGYTILCEMWTRSDPVTEGKTWRLRVTSSQEDLPLCEGQEEEEEEEGEGDEEKEKEREKVAEVSITTEFYLKEIRDYCLPDRDSVMFRYSLKAKQECPITVQLTTSKKDAHVNLEIFDGSELVAATQGRAYCFIPAFFLLPTNTSDDPPQTQHKYVMVASITHDSWQLPETAWPCIAEIQSAEEEKVAPQGGGGGGGKGKKPPSASSKGGGKAKKAKGGGKDGGGRDTSDGVQSSTSLCNIDASKPHWTLRVGVRQQDREWFEMGRDTEREEELKNMQTTWETQQPGRVKKGQESRQKFLDAHALKKPTENAEDQTDPEATQLPGTPSLSLFQQPPHAPVPLKRIDLSLYTKYSHSAPHVLTAEEREERDEERRELIRRYRAWRQSVLQSRNEDRQFRNEEKIRQLKEAEKQQSDLEATRKRMNRGREKIRQSYLAEEKARKEAEQAVLKATEEEAAVNSARDSKAKGKKGKKK